MEAISAYVFEDFLLASPDVINFVMMKETNLRHTFKNSSIRYGCIKGAHVDGKLPVGIISVK